MRNCSRTGYLDTGEGLPTTVLLELTIEAPQLNLGAT